METPPYHVSACCCLADNGHSALDGTGHHAADNVLLAGEVEDDDGQNADHNQRHHRTQVHMAVAALQVLDVDGDGLVLGAVQHQVGQEVVVPHPHDLQHAHGNEDGLEHGEHHREERAQRSAAARK